MVVAVNATFLQAKKLNSSNFFLYEMLMKMAEKYHQHQFIFIFYDAYDESIIDGTNVTSILIKSKYKNSFYIKFWYDIKLTKALKKYNPNVLLQFNSNNSNVTKLPHLLFLQDSVVEYEKKSVIKKSIITAKAIAVFSNFSKNKIIENYNVAVANVEVINAAPNLIFKPLNIDEITQVKDGFADGREYFLYVNEDATASNVMNTLRAFSLFKKWQRSNMKLLIVETLLNQKEIENKLKTYKYREDVVILDVEDHKLAKVMASAYCVLIPSFIETTGISIMNAMQCGVPVIASNTGSSFEIGANAALYINPNSFEELAEKMQLVYKDENLKSNLINDGLQQAAKYNIDDTVELLWNSIANIAI